MRTFVLRMSLLAAFVSIMAVAPARAQAQASDPGPAPATAPPAPLPGSDAPALHGPTVWGLLDWNGVGIGARYMLPLPIPSLLTHTKFRDSWALELGLDFLHRSDDLGIVNYHYNELIPTVGMMWIVWLNQTFAVYPKVEAGYAIGFDSSYGNCAGCDLGGIYAEGAAGLLYSIGGGLTLRAEVGNYGIKGGVAWLF
jgi:hypothetical protein